MCGSATLAIVLSTPCMIVASMIEAVIRARLAPALRSPPITGPGLRRRLRPARCLARTVLCHLDDNRTAVRLRARIGQPLTPALSPQAGRGDSVRGDLALEPDLRADQDAVAGIAV